jgi:hypothetical protein
MSHAAAVDTPTFGLLAEFDSAQALLDAARKVRGAGYTKTDAFSPFPIHGLDEAIGFHEHKIPMLVLLGGLTGLAAGWGLEYWTQVIAYPLNIGGRPYNAWVSFIPPAFETTILFASFTAAISMIVLNGLPQPYHPVFNAPRFNLASSEGFFLVVEAVDPKYDASGTKSFLESLHPREVVAVEN